MASALKRILYVEDEIDIQTIAVTVLEALGNFTVIVCNSGRQAIERAPEANADLIVLDVMMPGMDGPTTLKALRSIPQTAATPVIFVTAKVQAKEIEQLKALGALDVIAKPFDPMTLPERIAAIWGRWASAQGAVAPAVGSTPSQDTDDELQALFARYAEQLPANIAELERLWATVRAGDQAALKPLHRALHSIAGSGATFGYSQLGSSAKVMEEALMPYLAGARIPEAALDSLSSAFVKVKRGANLPD